MIFALQNSSFAIENIACPLDQQFVRLVSTVEGRQELSPGEEAYRQGRKSIVAPLWRAFFTNGPGAGTGYRSTSLMANIRDDWPLFGIAFSAGGERAVLYGAGVIQALHSSTTSSPIRGVYDLSSYASGVSGGSWLVTAMSSYENHTVPEIIQDMDLEKPLAAPDLISESEYIEDSFKGVVAKRLAGFRISVADIFGTTLSQHFLPRKTPTLLMSGLQNLTAFQKFQSPLPIIVTNYPVDDGTDLNPNKLPIQGDVYVPLELPVYEHTPFEFGSFDPQLSAFMLSEYLGTTMNSGIPSSSWSIMSFFNSQYANTKCVRGFDQLSFIMGASSALYNAALSTVESTISKKFSGFTNFITSFANIGLSMSVTASVPNPFKGLDLESANISQAGELSLVDGGENGEKIPLNPLLAPARQVDVILAVDSSADTDASNVNGGNWPNGASMINTWLRVHKVLPFGAANSPPVPLDPNVWIQYGWNTRPTFFGCNAPNQIGNGGYPLIIYLPNSPLSQTDYYTNTSTFKLQYSKPETSAFIKSVVSSTINPQVDTGKNDPSWATCLSCALIERARNRLGVSRSLQCRNCFARYCYQDGVRQRD